MTNVLNIRAREDLELQVQKLELNLEDAKRSLTLEHTETNRLKSQLLQTEDSLERLRDGSTSQLDEYRIQREEALRDIQDLKHVNTELVHRYEREKSEISDQLSQVNIVL